MSDFDLVKSQVDIVSYIQRNVDLKKTGNVYKASCPFHTEKSPSFVVNPTLQRWQCFGACGVGGSIIDFAMRFHGMSEAEALQDVASFGNIQLEKRDDPHKRLYELLDQATRIYGTGLYSSYGETALGYLCNERALNDDIIRQAKIGYAPDRPGSITRMLNDLGYSQKEMLEAGILAKSDDGRIYEVFRNRIMIPIFDQQGRVVGFNGRAMGSDQPKYKNSPETALFKKSKILYTLREKNAQGRALEGFKVKVLVEGPFDVISGHLKGFKNVYAQMGSALSLDQLSQLAKHDTEKIVFCFDNDPAGENMMRRLAKEHIHSAARLGVDLLIMRPPHGKDADDTFRERDDLWLSAVDNARPVVDVLIDLELAGLPQNASGIQKTKAALELTKVLRHDNRLIEQENFGKLAARLNLTADEMERIARPQLTILAAPPAPKVESIGLPTTEEWVLHGILTHEADSWLVRANSCLLIASDSPMPYALAPLSAQDFTDPQTRRFFEISAKSQAAEEMIRGNIDKSLEALYERIKGLNTIGDALGIPFDYDIFISHVYELRLKRLRKERPTFEGKDVSKARECAMAIACLQLAAEEMI